jgi:hypothetical protein
MHRRRNDNLKTEPSELGNTDVLLAFFSESKKKEISQGSKRYQKCSGRYIDRCFLSCGVQVLVSKPNSNEKRYQSYYQKKILHGFLLRFIRN